MHVSSACLEEGEVVTRFMLPFGAPAEGSFACYLCVVFCCELCFVLGRSHCQEIPFRFFSPPAYMSKFSVVKHHMSSSRAHRQ